MPRYALPFFASAAYAIYARDIIFDAYIDFSPLLKRMLIFFFTPHAAILLMPRHAAAPAAARGARALFSLHTCCHDTHADMALMLLMLPLFRFRLR